MLDTVRFLRGMLAQQDLDALVLILISRVVHDVAVHAGHHLPKLASDSLLAVLDHASNVGVCACILITKLIAIRRPHLLESIEDKGCFLLPAESKLRQVGPFALRRLVLLQLNQNVFQEYL